MPQNQHYDILYSYEYRDLILVSTFFAFYNKIISLQRCLKNLTFALYNGNSNVNIELLIEA